MVPWKLLLFIVVVTICIMFVGFNLDYRMTFSLGFAKIENAPTIIVLAIVFMLGMLFSFIVIFIKTIKSNKKLAQKEKPISNEDTNKKQ